MIGLSGPVNSINQLLMRALPEMTECQQRLYCTLALLEESDLKTFFRMVRYDIDSIPEVELVNTELDRGIRLMDIFGPLGPLQECLNGRNLVFEALNMNDGRWSIDFGFRGRQGYGARWIMNIAQDGTFTNVEAARVWVPMKK